MPDFRYRQTAATLNVGGALFRASGRQPIEFGWSDTHTTLRLHRELVEAARDEAGLFGRSTAAQVEHWARLGRAFEAARGATTERVRQALQGRLPIEALEEVEQDAVFDGMLDAYADPPAGVRDRLAGVAERTREVLGREHAERQDAAA